MIEFLWPWVFATLPLPFLVRLLKPVPAGQQGAALIVPVAEDFQPIESPSIRPGRSWWRFWLALLCWALLVLAAARPQLLGEPVPLPVTGRDLMLAVDLSGSMQEQDFLINQKPVDRLTATKWVAGEFIERRIGDRVGLILFGERAYLQAPLTFDRKTVRTLLDESVIGLAGQFTAIGDAIGLAVKRLRERDQKNRVLILLTDGANTAGEVDPIQATRIAAEAGLKIYTVGIGADAMLVNSRFGRRQVNPSRNLDEKALRNIAELTGGRYFRARDTQEMEKIYAELDRLEPVTEEELNYRPTKSLYMWPLSISLILAALLVLYQQRRSTHG
ncbi:MAG: VWA domain-containing protein [Gammaproteobacteria bacterium]|jgi:Ca-activated chloride channel family protein|nr:VWA domain-containing protein [Gammaproteobacteria bacterium]